MRRRLKILLFLGLLVAALYLVPNPRVRPANVTAATAKQSMGRTQFVTVAPDVELEVIDYGGAGRPLVLLAGLGGQASAFDGFVDKLTPHFHVYALTRRGFGKSSVSAGGYDAFRLGDDVLAVIDTLHLPRPLLVGHSFAGAEMSAVATRHPEKVSGLIYLDAGYGYALYDPTAGNVAMHVSAILRWIVPALPPVCRSVRLMIYAGQKKFNELHVPVLAIYADPHDLSKAFRSDPAGQAKAEAEDRQRTDRQADAFARQVPAARIIRLPHASHEIYRSNEAEVLRALENFAQALPP